MNYEEIKGRDAITVLVQDSLDQVNLSEDDREVLHGRVVQWMKWWMMNGKTREEAVAIVANCKASDKYILEQEDIFADFVWSRGDEVGQAEISLTDMKEDFEVSSNDEFFKYKNYWDLDVDYDEHLGFNKPGQRQSYGLDPFTVKMSAEVLEKLGSFINRFVEVAGKREFNSKERSILQRMRTRINQLRFGVNSFKDGIKYTKGGGELIYNHWAIAMNMVNPLLGITKKYEVKATADEVEDAMDAMPFFYGTNAESLTESNEVEAE